MPTAPTTSMQLARQQGDADSSAPPQRDGKPADAAASSSSPQSFAQEARPPAASSYTSSRELDKQLFSISVPMLATLAADPLAGLMDAVYLGHAGSVELAAVGVALSIFNTITKVFNMPLLSVTTSCVAAAAGAADVVAYGAAVTRPEDKGPQEREEGEEESRSLDVESGGGAKRSGSGALYGSASGGARGSGAVNPFSLLSRRGSSAAATSSAGGRAGGGASRQGSATAALQPPPTTAGHSEDDRVPLLADRGSNESWGNGGGCCQPSGSSPFAQQVEDDGRGEDAVPITTTAAAAAAAASTAASTASPAVLPAPLGPAEPLEAALGSYSPDGAPSRAASTALQTRQEEPRRPRVSFSTAAPAAAASADAAAATPATPAAGASAAAATATATTTTAKVASALQTRAAFSCLVLGLLLGAVQAVALLSSESGLLRMWGLTGGTDVYGQAAAFLRVRAVGAPVTVLVLTLQGVYRGLQDTRTPLYATLLSNGINVVLAPILIFGMRMGVVGAAIATVAAQLVTLLVLAKLLIKRLPLLRRRGAADKTAASLGGVSHPPESTSSYTLLSPLTLPLAGSVGDGGDAGYNTAAPLERPWQRRQQAWRGAAAAVAAKCRRLAAPAVAVLREAVPLFRPTGYMVVRGVSVAAAYAVATRLVAGAGPTVTASYQVAFQLWLACGLLSDALAVAAQSLMARDLGARRPWDAARVAARVAGLSGMLGLGTGLALLAGWRVLPRAFSSDPAVLHLVSDVLPLIAAIQPVTVLAMTWDGILYGAGGFRYAAISMCTAAVPAMLTMVLSTRFVKEEMAEATVAAGPNGLPLLYAEKNLLLVVWLGLTLLMLLRWLTIAVPYMLRVGPFAKLRACVGDEDELLGAAAQREGGGGSSAVVRQRRGARGWRPWQR